MNLIEHTCLEDETLISFQLGDLSTGDIDHVERAIESCERCAARLSEFDEVDDPTGDLLRQYDVRFRTAVAVGYQSDIERMSPIAALMGGSDDDDGGQVDAPNDDSGGYQLPLDLGRYLLNDVIGRGGMGVVVRATDKKMMNRTVAIKLPIRKLSNDATILARFQREVSAMGINNHSNIVQATDKDEHDGIPFLVMEYVDGFDAKKLIETTGCLSIEEACEIVRQAAQGLSRAHKNGLVHRDIKPENLMTTTDGQVKLLDWGLVRDLKKPSKQDRDVVNVTKPFSFLGTATYAPPEQFEDAHNVDQRADIYALGCTLFCLLTGKPPFGELGDKTVLKLLNAHANSAIPKLTSIRDEVPKAIETIVEQMMAKDANKRPQTMTDVLAIVEPFTGGGKAALTRRMTEYNKKPAPYNQHAETMPDQSYDIKPDDGTLGRRSEKGIWLTAGTALVALSVLGFSAVQYVTQTSGEQQAKSQNQPTPEDTTAVTNDVETAISQFKISAGLKTRLLAELAKHSEIKKPLIFVDSDVRYVLMAQSIESGTNRRFILNKTRELGVRATAELIKSDAVLKQLKNFKLNDEAALNRAIKLTAGRVQGVTSGVSELTRQEGDTLVALVYAPRKDIHSTLLSDLGKERFLRTYYQCVEDDFRKLMLDDEWSQALDRSRHLIEHNKAVPDVYLETARCFIKLEKPNEAVGYIDQVIESFKDSTDIEFFEKAGDLIRETGIKTALPIAEKAYDRVIEIIEAQDNSNFDL